MAVLVFAGVYLTTVMTMTSVSVIMAVLVINLYNRGSKATRAPGWLKFLLLEWLARALRLKHDVDAMTSVIKLVSLVAVLCAVKDKLKHD